MTSNRLSVYATFLALAAVAVLCAGGCTPPGTHNKPFSASRDDDEFNKGTDRPPSPRTMFALGKLLASQGRDAEASVVFTKLITQEPRFIPAYHELAAIQLRHNRINEAAAVLSAGLSAAPRDAVLRNNLGMCRLFQKDYRQAVACFAAAAAAAPGDGRYRANLALSLGMLGRHDECLAVYEQVVRPAEAHFNLAVICDARGEADRAGKEYAQAYSLDPDLKGKPIPAGARGR